MVDWVEVREWIGPGTGALALIVSIIGLVSSRRAKTKAATASTDAASAALLAADAQQRIAAVVEAQAAPPGDYVRWRTEYTQASSGGGSAHVYVLRNVGTITATEVVIERYPAEFPSLLRVAGEKGPALRPGEGLEFYINNSMGGKLQQIAVTWHDSTSHYPREDVLRLA